MRETDGPFFPIEAVDPGARGEIGRVAEILASSGFAVFPCRAKMETWIDSKGKTQTGKPKTPKVAAWQKRATSSLRTVRSWWSAGHWPDAMVGIPTGAINGFWVLDADTPKKPGDPDGRETLKLLEARHGPLPPTPTVSTPSGGLHLCFRWTPGIDEALVNRARILPGLDVRCTGGYVIGPWSFNAERGRPYVLESDPSTPLAEAPAWLLDLLRESKRPLPMEGTPGRERATPPGPLPGSDEWDSLARLDYGEALRSVREATEGSRNATLNGAAYSIFRKIRLGKIPASAESDIRKDFLEEARGTGLEDREIGQSLESAWKGAMAKPLTAAETRSMERAREWRDRREFRKRNGVYSPTGQEQGPPPEWEDVPIEAYSGEDFGGPAPDESGHAACPRPSAPSPVLRDLKPPPMDGIEAVKSKAPVVVVLTVEEARAFREDGVAAIAVGAVENVGPLVLAAQRARRTAPLVYHEDGGELCKALSAYFFNNPSVPSVRGSLYPEGSSAFETASMERGRLREAVRAVSAPWREEVRGEYLSRHSMEATIEEFLKSLAEGGEDNSPISTGFERLDNALEGGLYPGLYVLGAIPSNGKTTLALQIAENIAAQGRDVLIFSYETKKKHLMARTVSRWTRRLVAPDGEALSLLLTKWPDYPEDKVRAIREMAAAVGRPQRGRTLEEVAADFAKTARDVLRGDLYSGYSFGEKALLEAAFSLHKITAGKVFVHFWGRGFGVDRIRAAVEDHVQKMGSLPVVVVDYVQRVAPFDPRSTDKQRVDDNMEALQALASEKEAVVLGISSFNRDSYNKKAAMQSFKESGGIDFSSDVMLGLQLEGTGDSNFDVDEAKRASPRKIELLVIKNRNGPTAGKIRFDYSAAFNLFIERES